MTEKYFDIETDKQFPCFCQACLVGKSEEQMSKRDVRYCLDCQPFIEREYSRLRQRYIPITYNHQNHQIDTFSNADIETHRGKQKKKMSTIDSAMLRVDKLKPRIRSKTYKKRILPDGQIKQLHNEGMGSKAITNKLRVERGITVSYKTIQRVLSGQRR